MYRSKYSQPLLNINKTKHCIIEEIFISKPDMYNNNL